MDMALLTMRSRVGNWGGGHRAHLFGSPDIDLKKGERLNIAFGGGRGRGTRT